MFSQKITKYGTIRSKNHPSKNVFIRKTEGKTPTPQAL